MSTTSSPAPRIQELSRGSNQAQKKSSISQVISETFPSFDHRSIVVEPFDNESKRDVDFLEKFNDMLLDLMLEFHAWSTARPTRESDSTAEELEKEINAVIELETEQEKTRQRLNDFVTRIKLALAALTGLVA